jgi:homocysteine S-methyltransferase
MARYRHGLPQLDGGIFLSDGGMETTFIFHDGMELPHFASCVLLETPEGRFHLRNYYERYLAMARGRGVGFVLDSATWRANPDWGRKLGYDAARLAAVNRAAIALLVELRDLWEAPSMPCVISGAIGPRGDGYRADRTSVAEAEDYHAAQIATFASTEADMVAAFTINHVEEAIGIAQAAKRLQMPCAISFTVETDGRLVTGNDIARRDRGSRDGDGRLSSLLHDQLRPSEPFHAGSGSRRDLGSARPWRPRQRLGAQPCRARRFDRTRCRRSRRFRPPLR